MSLINKMLGDLEKRDAFLYEKQNTVLDGLYSAYDLELDEKKKSYLFPIIVFVVLLIITIILTVDYLYSKNGEHINHISENINAINNEPIPRQNSVADKEIILSRKNVTTENASTHFLKLDDNLLIDAPLTNTLASPVFNTETLNRIDEIYFEVNEQGINLVMKMPEDIDYLVYGLSNPNRIVVEINNAELGFLLEELEPVGPIVAIRYSINKENRLKLVLESEQLLTIRKSTTGESSRYHDLVVMMEYQWQENKIEDSLKDSLNKIVEQQVNEEKEIVFKGELVKTQRNRNENGYVEKLFKQAYAEYKNGDIKNSLKKLNMVLDLDASHVNARSTLALILSKQGHLDIAYSVLNEGLIQYPDQIEWVKMTARLLLSEEKIVDAKELLLKFTPDLVTNVDYYALLSAVLQQLNEHNESARIYRDLLQLNPSKSVWWMGLGISLESLKRYEDALYAYQKAYKNPSIAGDSRDFLTQRINMLSNLIKDEST